MNYRLWAKLATFIFTVPMVIAIIELFLSAGNNINLLIVFMLVYSVIIIIPLIHFGFGKPKTNEQ